MKEQEHYAESVQYSIDRTKASLEELAHDFLSSDLLKGLIEGANTFLQKVDEIISKLGTLGTVITGVAAGSTIHGLFTNEGMVAGGIKALTNQKFGEANQRRSMWGNIRQLLGWDEPYYDIEESKSAMAQNATEEFKDAAAKENTAGASATKTAAIEAETAAMEANTQAIQQNTAAENGDTLSDKAHEIMNDESYLDDYANAIDFDDAVKEAGTDAGSEYAQSFTQAQMDMMNDGSFQEIQDLMSENLDDVIDVEQMFESGSNIGEALGEGISENMRKVMMDSDTADILSDQFEDSFDMSQVMDIGENISDAITSGISGTGEVVIDEFQNVGEALRDSEILTRSAIRTAAQDAMAESAVVLEQTATPAASGFVAKFTAGISGIAGKIGAVLTSINPVVLAGGAALGILLGKSIYDSYKNYLIKTASSATDKFQDRKDQISGYEERYASINEKLSSSDTSETERVQLRQQLIDLQREIVSGLGGEAAGIDVVNGKYEEQVGLMDRLVEKQAEKNLNDKDVQKAYKDAEDEMTKPRTYSLGEIFDMSDRTIGKKFFDSVKDEIDGLGLDLADGEGLWYDENSYEIKFKGDATEASQAISVVESQLEKFRTKYKDDDYVQGVLNGVSDGMQNAVKDNEELLDKYQENYKNFLEQEFYTDDATKNNRTALRDMARAATDLNTAIASGDTKTFNEALSAYEDINKTAEGFGDKYKVVFDDIRDTIDETGKSAMEFKDVLDDDGIIGKDNPLAKQADELKQAAEEVKEEGLQAIDLQDLDLTPEKASESLKKLAGAFDIAFNGTDEDNAKIKSLISTLVELGVVADDVSNNIEATAEDSFESFRSSIINDIANIDTLNAAIAESFSGKGLSYSIDENGEVVGAVSEIKKAYSELMEDAEVDQSSLFQSTALGLKTNQTALRALQSELEAKNKLELNNQLEEAQKNVDDLQSRFGKMDKEAFPERYDKLKGELDAAKSDLESVRELQAAYEGATSAYQKWVNAQSMGEEGDVYNAIRETAFKRGDELLEQGLVGTNEFRAIAQMFSDEDLSTAGIEKIISEYQAGSAAVKSFFTEGYEGLAKFGEDAASKGIEGIKEVRDEAGNLGYAFENVDVQQIADAYGVSASVIESIFGRMADYGIEVQRYSGEASEDIQKLNQQATEAQKTLKDHVTEFKTATEETNAEMQKLQEGGNVDLFNRPQISTQKLIDAGWDKDEVGEGTATVYSSTYSNEDGTVAMNFTPILPDGSVMEPGEFDRYCGSVVEGAEDTLNLKIGATFEGENAVAEADAAAQRIHELQESYYGLTGKQIDLDFNVEDLDTIDEIDTKLKELETLKASPELDDSQLEAVETLMDTLQQKKELIQQATNIPVGYSDLESANTAASQLKDRITEITNSDHVTNVDVAIQNDEKVNALAQEIANLPKDAQVEIGVKEENTGSAQAIIQQIQENPASIKVTPELVKNDLDQEGTIKYSAEITKPIPESELNKKGTITYNSKIGKALNSRQLHKSETINQTTNVTKNETTNKTVNTTVTGNATQAVGQIKNALAGLQSKSITVGVTDNATVKINKIKAAESKLQDKSFNITANDHASAVINKVAAMTIPSKSVTITSNASAVAIGISNLARQINSLQNKTVTITKKTVTVPGYNGTANAFGTAYADGTVPSYFRQKRIGSVGNSMINHYNGNAHAKGSWGLKRDEPNALINELGPEIVVLCKICYHVWRHACKITSNC